MITSAKEMPRNLQSSWASTAKSATGEVRVASHLGMGQKAHSWIHATNTGANIHAVHVPE